jgi:hypothetical protein
MVQFHPFPPKRIYMHITPDIELMWEKINDTVVFYCPDCNEKLTVLHHVNYICGCGKKWLTPSPICVSNGKIKAIRTIN